MIQPNDIKKFIAASSEAALLATDVAIKSEQNTIEFYLEKKDKLLDKEIIEWEKSLAAIYLGGELALILDENDHFHLKGILYFKKADGSLMQKEVENSSIPMYWAFTPSEQEKLREAKILKFNHSK